MQVNRRQFVKTSFGAGALLSGSLASCSTSKADLNEMYEKLDEAAALPVLKREYFKSPIIIKSAELLRLGGNYLCRVRSLDGAEGMSVSNNAHMKYLYPLLLHRIVPVFKSKDARDLDQLVHNAYAKNSNYKLQGLALWISLATVEFAVLDMLGKIVGKSIGELIGTVHHKKISVYRANNYRGQTAEVSLEKIKKTVAETGAKAVKFKVGGRMSNNEDYPTGRTEKLIPMVREAFGDEMTIYADSNSSYTVDKAIEVGRLMEQYNYDFYEEPVPFDWLEETKQVADALTVPIAGGEQETSLHRFRWLIANDALQIVQPDMFYFGGMIRSMRVARMAEAVGLQCVPHISGSGLGYVYMMHFVSTVPNAGPYHEFKGFNANIPVECDSSSLKSEDGVVTVPSGPGMGLTLDPEFVMKHRLVKL